MMSKRTFLILLAVLFCAANLTRWGFRSQYGHPRFIAEGAAHYRYTAMAARGEAVPALDRKAQWFEGLRVYHETSIGMEYLYGTIYRLIPGRKPGLPSFIRYFTAFFFSLAIWPLAFLSVRLWRSYGAGVITASLFAVVLSVVARSSGYELIRENVTFPLLIFHIYFFCTAWSDGGVYRAGLSGLFLFLALATWQGTQFYLVPFLLFLIIARLLEISGAGGRRAGWIVAVSVLAAGAAVPFLRSSGFLLSLPVALCAGWAGVDLSAGRSGVTGKKRLIIGMIAAVAGAACVLVPALATRGHLSSYAHFFGLIFYKLKLVNKPADPTLLPFDARAFWVGPFHSPDPRHFFVFALPVLLLLPGPVSALVRRAREKTFLPLFAFVFLIVFLALFLLMMRLLPLLGIFAALVAGGNAIAPVSPGGARFRIRPAVVLTLAVIVISLLQDFAFERPHDVWRRLSRILRIPSREKFVVYPDSRDVDGELFTWIRNNTPRDSALMTLHYLSPQVLTYTGRATALNDFFESPALRRKAERFLRMLYADEWYLQAFCREYGCDYLLVSISICCDPTRDSPLYQAGFASIPPESAAFRLIFEPGRLKHFRLVYENEMYRLFKVGEPPIANMWPRSPLFYERELLQAAEGDIGDFLDSVNRIYALTARGQLHLRRGREREGETRLRQALRSYYFYPAWRELNELFARRGRARDREALAEFAFRFDPNRSEVCIELAKSRLAVGKHEGVRELLDRCAVLGTIHAQREEIARLKQYLDAY